MMMLTRREFVRGAVGAAGGMAWALALPGCGREELEEIWPLLEVAGESREIGQQIGKRFSTEIRDALEDRGGWWRALKALADSQPRELYEKFLAAARLHAPSVLEELEGLADGCGLPFRDLMILNHKAEYAALRHEIEAGPSPETPGCSTIAFAGQDRDVLVHNEDGDMAYASRMYLLRIRRPGKPEVFCACYPGILPGNAPWTNDRGVLMTTNFIATREVRPGVGRYFLNRLAMEAQSITEAIEISRHPERAYGYHYFIGSASEERIVSLEVTPTRDALQEITGLFMHTNHLISPALAEEPQHDDYVGSSSMGRWSALCRWRDGLGDAAASVSEEQMVKALSNHENRPYSPCRHPQGDVRGATMLNAVFDLQKRTVRMTRGQPCRSAHHEYRF